MTRIETLDHHFVGSFPAQLEPGILYIAPEYATMSHLCCCGCGNEVVTPLSPKDWRMTFDGESVTVHPSIGSWSLPCMSHYVIRDGRVRWAGQWSEEQIRMGRECDLAAKREQSAARVDVIEGGELVNSPAPTRPSLIRRIHTWLKR